MDRHGLTAALGDGRIFTTLHEAIAAVRGGARAGTTTTKPHGIVAKGRDPGDNESGRD
jgi:hypothetical protein